MYLDSPLLTYSALVNKIVDGCGKGEKVKAALKKKLMLRDKNVRKKSNKWDITNDQFKEEKTKEQNDKLLRITGKEEKMHPNEKLAWISGKAPSDQVNVRVNFIENDFF